MLNIVSAYMPQVRLEEKFKKEFWENMDIIKGVPISEKFVIG